MPAVSRDMLCLANIGSVLSDTQIALINQSETLVSYFTQYEASVISGINKPIEFGDGSYASPTFNLDGSVNTLGVARVAYSAAVALDVNSIINHFAHELGHAFDRVEMDGYYYSVLGNSSLSKTEKSIGIVNACLMAEASAYVHEYIVSNEIYGATGSHSQNGFHRELVENAIAQTVALYPGLSDQQFISRVAEVFSQNISESLPNRLDQCQQWITILSDNRDLGDFGNLRIDLASDNSSAVGPDSLRFGVKDPTTNTIDYLDTFFGNTYSFDRFSVEGISAKGVRDICFLNR